MVKVQPEVVEVDPTKVERDNQIIRTKEIKIIEIEEISIKKEEVCQLYKMSKIYNKKIEQITTVIGTIKMSESFAKIKKEIREIQIEVKS